MASYTNYCCRSGGSNLNAGTLTGDTTEPGTSASFTYASGNFVQSTGVFTVASGNPQSDGVAVGDFASVYADGSTVTGFVGRVTAVSTTTITVSTTVKSGTAPTDGTGNRTLKIGGAWLGPNAASGFPMNFVQNTGVNSSGHLPRINYKNDATYRITANINNLNADIFHQGYTSAFGDFGKAILDGGTSGASYNLIGTTVGTNAWIADFEFRNNGATGNASGVFWNTSAGGCVRCVFHDFRGSGLQSNNITYLIECEAYANNKNNTANLAGFHLLGAAICIRCIAHDNTGSNVNGFFGGGPTLINCISESNGLHGFLFTGSCVMKNLDSYLNGGDGFRSNNSSNGAIYIENSNFVKNTGYGINFAGAGKITALFMNCGFGAGTFANSGGTTNAVTQAIEVGTVTYTSNISPYVDADDGDFRIYLASQSVGRGNFTQTASGYSGSLGYPHIGAVDSRHPRAGGRFGGF